MDLIVKWSEHYPLGQVLFFRGFFGLVLYFLIMPRGRIKIFYSAICASDIPRAYFNQSYFYPLILGHEFSGKIVQCGKNVNNNKIGQRVSVFPLIPKCNKCENCKKKEFRSSNCRI